MLSSAVRLAVRGTTVVGVNRPRHLHHMIVYQLPQLQLVVVHCQFLPCLGPKASLSSYHWISS
jgi:hypothetical protein